MRRLAPALTPMFFTLAAPVAAVAQTASEGYGATPGISTGSPGATLPFTGFEALIVAAAAVLLLALGVALRKASGTRVD